MTGFEAIAVDIELRDLDFPGGDDDFKSGTGVEITPEALFPDTGPS